jgi:uncharacterized protein (TIGR02646 family)
MHKVDKDFSCPPASLTSMKTKVLRDDIIKQRKYPAQEKYDDRFKQDDIKTALKEIYHNKCVYCEQDIRDAFVHIEHYRPKSIYYWLVYSWDNLFLCCEKCNTNKGNRFETETGKRVRFSKSTLKDIHNLAAKYNKIEKPLLINPELEDIEDKLVFDLENGNIRSTDPRCQHTVDCCKLDRAEANDNRKEIWDEFYKRVSAIIYRISLNKKRLKDEEITGIEFKMEYHQEIVQLKALIRYFKEDANDPGKEYLTFRRYVVKNHELFK